MCTQCKVVTGLLPHTSLGLWNDSQSARYYKPIYFNRLACSLHGRPAFSALIFCQSTGPTDMRHSRRLGPRAWQSSLLKLKVYKARRKDWTDVLSSICRILRQASNGSLYIRHSAYERFCTVNIRFTGLQRCVSLFFLGRASFCHCFSRRRRRLIFLFFAFLFPSLRLFFTDNGEGDKVLRPTWC